MTNQKNMRGNPNPNTNQTQSDTLAPAPSPSTPNTPSNQPPAPPSLATRIQASATSLAKSAFRPSSDLANTLASSTSSKPDPSSLPNPQTSRDPPSNTTLHGSPGSASASAAQAFREHNAHASTADKHVLPALTEDDFQGRKHRHDGIDTGDERQTDLLHTTTTVTDPKASTIQPHKDLQTPSSAWKGKARAHDPTQHQFETVWQRQWHVLHDPQTRVTATTDGAAVVSLLSDANFDPNFEDPMSVPDAEIDFAAVPASLSVAERDMLDSFRRGLGLDGKREGEGNGRLTGASLVPDLDVFLSQGFGAGVGIGTREGNATTTGARSTSTSLRDAVLTNLPGAGDWVGVQERYHDEVWGYLQPVLAEARVEIEEKGAREDGPAVRRLKMILVHMKG